MSLLLETIKVENGKPENLQWHNRRFNKARKELFSLPEQDLQEVIVIPENCRTGLFRCRVLYSTTIDKIEFIPHQAREIRSLQVVRHDSIDYRYKYADRSELQVLYNQRGQADEIIIIKEGLVTDCFIGNLVFFDGQQWLTPDQPLLKGTQRQKLLAEGQIHEARITENDLLRFEEIGLINVFFDLNNMPRIKKDQITTETND
jgi:4-amino-4-deoxychorismate lyase